MNRSHTIQQTALRILTQQLRTATTMQLARGISLACDVPWGQAVKAIAALRRRRLLVSQIVPIVLPSLTSPLATWQTGEPQPDFDAVAWAAQQRLDTCSSTRVCIHWATRRAVQLVGGVGGSLRKPLQIEHDLGVAAAFVVRATTDRATITGWIGEDYYLHTKSPARREKIPDAVQLGTDGRPSLVIDFISRYPANRLREFHDYWALRRTFYEWW